MDSKNKQENFKTKWRKFSLEHPILYNLMWIIFVGCFLMWASLMALDIWTDHGHYQVVPSVKGMSYSQAVDELARHNLGVEITDSIYDSTVAPGTVTEQTPRPDSKVKS
jgi:beta-lactam-binding protein with PASTA domain